MNDIVTDGRSGVGVGAGKWNVLASQFLLIPAGANALGPVGLEMWLLVRNC